MNHAGHINQERPARYVTARPNGKPDQCAPREEKRKECPVTLGDEEVVRRVWEDLDAPGHMFMWQCLLSF